MEINKKRNNIIVHWNCNFFLSNYDPDIIILNETKLNDFSGNNLFNQLINYNYIHKQRHEKNGAGGVALLLKKELRNEQYGLLDLNIELIAIKNF